MYRWKVFLASLKSQNIKFLKQTEDKAYMNKILALSWYPKAIEVLEKSCSEAWRNDIVVMSMCCLFMQSTCVLVPAPILSYSK